MEATNYRQAEDYTTVWIVALECEFRAAKKMLDKQHAALPMHDKFDDNTYTYGDVNGHNIVIITLAHAQTGKVTAHKSIQHLPRAFPNIHTHMFVGIGGGVPCSFPSTTGLPNHDGQKDIRLGDVAISSPTPGDPAVYEYDSGRQHAGVFESKSLLDKPGTRVVNALTPILAAHKDGDSIYSKHLDRAVTMADFKRPKSGSDVLFPAKYLHQGPTDTPCSTSCDRSRRIGRARRDSSTPAIHEGTILSADTVMMDAVKRDSLSQKHYNAICFETEAAGIMDAVHPFVIRGIADYADSHKNSTWQHYAAATAAAFAREILYAIQPVRLDVRYDANGRASSEFIKLKIRQKVDNAYRLIDERNKKSRKEDLENVQKTLLEARAELSQATVVDPSLHNRVTWGLMVTEKELSYYKGFDLPTKLGHIKEAKRYCDGLERDERSSLDKIFLLHVQIEQNVLKGEQALLDFELGADREKVLKLKRKAIKGLDEALKELKALDYVQFQKVLDDATESRDRFFEPLC